MEGNNWSHGDKIVCIRAEPGPKTMFLTMLFGKAWPLKFGEVYTVEELYDCDGTPTVSIQEYPPRSGEPICDSCHRAVHQVVA